MTDKNRRNLLLGSLGALASGAINPAAFAQQASMNLGTLGSGHHPAKAKRVIYLFQGGGPAQMELFDYKPETIKRHLQELPASVLGTSRLTGMSSQQSTFPVVKPLRPFTQHGESGAWVSDLMPHTASIVDKISFIKTIHTEPINHMPAVQFAQSGFQLSGRPSFGSWISYALGSNNSGLPPFIVLNSASGFAEQPIDSSAWSNGFLPSQYQGVRFLPGKMPVVYLENPQGMTDADRRRTVDYITELGGMQYDRNGDPEVLSRLSQYDMAYRMQGSVPEAVDIDSEPESTFELYGPDARKPGSYAYNCVLARRLIERDVRFVQLYNRAWDQHDKLPGRIVTSAKDADQASAALILDLEQRGLLEDTIVIWGGEFGRTVYSQGPITADSYGRDHHVGCTTYWMAGGGIKGGYSHGETDDFSYRIVKDGVHIHDLHATLLHLLGIDHERLTYRFQGRDFRLTDVHGKVVHELLA